MSRATVQAIFDAMAQPLWVLRADASIDHANGCARELMAAAPWLAAQGGRIAGIGDIDADALRRLVGAAASTTGAVIYSSAGRLRRALLRVTPLGGVDPVAQAWPQARALAVLELGEEADPAHWIARLAAHHRLTPAEHRVLGQLAAGATPAEIAQAQHVAPATVRTHLRSLFDKLGVRRQAELVRLAWGG